VFSLHSLDVNSIVSQETHFMCPYTRPCFEDNRRTTCLHCSNDKGEIFIFSLVVSLGKYAFRIQNLSLFIDHNIKNGIAVVQ